MIDTQLAHFKITGKLGEGGMGEVYRAEDTRLGREVAIKVLPEAVAADPERLARFEREAKVLASLNHPNIAGIHQIEEVEGQQLLVMELAEGADLTEHIAQGPIPLEKALPIALQIAEALEAADSGGIVHRDLKPANVKVTQDGKVKVLDFGLAKALDAGVGPEAADSISLSPTLTAQMTQAGVLLGTAAYMSPEQARGETVDRRSDIWAFGIVLMEMLTGERVYGGRTVSDTLAGVLAREPDWGALPGDLPPSLRRLLERCLEKEARDRLQAIGEARLVIERYLEDPEADHQSSPSVVGEAMPARPSRLPWALAGLAAAAALVLVVLNLQLSERANRPQPLIRASLLPPEGHGWYLDGFRPGRVAISPDGTQVAYAAVAEAGTERSLWVQPLSSTIGRPLPSTEGAGYPFWSPDGRYVGFFTDDKVKKIAVAGGPPVSLVDADNGKSGSWNDQGVIVFAASSDTPIFRVSAAGGESVPLTELDLEAGDNSHRHPVFLPDGQHFLYLARRIGSGDTNMLRLGSLDGSVDRDLLATPSNAAYAEGQLLFIREGTLMAQPFDVETLTLEGEAKPLVENVLELPSAALSIFSVSDTGTLVYQTGSAVQSTQLEWWDRDGSATAKLGEPVDQTGLAVSGDGTLVAAVVVAEDDQQDVWLYDSARGLRSRFTFDDKSDIAPTISPGQDLVVFSSDRNGTFDLYLKTIGGTGDAELLLANDGFTIAHSWTPDGKMVLMTEFLPGSGSNIYTLSVEGDRTPVQLTETEFGEGHPIVSPDGQWLAYSSNESGDWEVYVTTFPNPERKWQVSADGGRQPKWTREGSEIVYISATRGAVMAAEVDGTGDTFKVGAVQQLFELDVRSNQGRNWDVTADGERFLINVEPESGWVSPLQLAVNWPQILEEP